MDIRLYYIAGLSKEDTPYFASVVEQKNYFETKKVITISDATYYPPMYRNKIRLETTVFNPLSGKAVNYLSLYNVANGHNFYYFIKDIIYINESLFEIEIEMDTIQTYMFDIRVSSAIIERKSIARWVRPYPGANTYIKNTNFIRENFSKGTFILSRRHTLERFFATMSTASSSVANMFDTNGKYIGPWIIAKLVAETRHIGGTTDNFAKVSYERVDTTRGVSDGVILYCPLFRLGVYKYKSFTGQGTYELKDPNSTEAIAGMGRGLLYDLIADPDVVDIYVVRNLPVDSEIQSYFRFDVSNGYWIYNNNGSYQNDLTVSWGSGKSVSFIDKRVMRGPLASNVLEEATPYGTLADASIRVKTASLITFKNYSVYTTDVSQYFVKSANTNKTNLYNYEHEPALFDENYLDFTFGTINCSTRYPLHKLTTPSLSSGTIYLQTNLDLGTGLYTYSIRTANTQNADLDYNSVIVDTNKIAFPMFNDAWKEYQAANKMRWQAAAVSDAVTVAGMVAKVGLSSYANQAYAKKKASTILNNPKSYTKKGNLKVSAMRSLADIEGTTQEDAIRAMASGLGSIGTGQGFDVLITEKNTMGIPPVPTQTGDYYNSAYCSVNDLYTQTAVVNDYKYCALMYHMYGNLVMEHVFNSDVTSKYYNLFDQSRIRYYFNYIKCSDISLDVISGNANCIISEDIKADIISRYCDGLRLWSVYDYTGIAVVALTMNGLTDNYKYDNIEINNIA